MVAISSPYSFTVNGSTNAAGYGGTTGDHIIHVPRPTRKQLDKNGSYLPNFGYGITDYAWAGAATLASQFLGTTTIPTWSPPMHKKFTPKKCKKPGWRD